MEDKADRQKEKRKDKLNRRILSFKILIVENVSYFSAYGNKVTSGNTKPL
jgi:hypothetical protein